MRYLHLRIGKAVPPRPEPFTVVGVAWNAEVDDEAVAGAGTCRACPKASSSRIPFVRAHCPPTLTWR
jgi:hypothetical protein